VESGALQTAGDASDSCAVLPCALLVLRVLMLWCDASAPYCKVLCTDR
jgi:hypothetical protein